MMPAMTNPRLGVLTLGQTPRDDVLPTLRAFLGDAVQLIERGALDGLDAAGLDAYRARPGEPVLETRLRGGAPIGLSKALLTPRLIAIAAQLASECDALLLLCSGEFPALAAACPGVIEPVRILRGAVNAAAAHRRLGLIGPASDLADAPAQWRPYAPDVICAPASPYDPPGSVAQAARALVASGAHVLYLDDMGFNESHRLEAARAVSLPVLCATTLVARVLPELLGVARSGRVLSVHLSVDHAFSKFARPVIHLLAGLGVEGDAHCGRTVKHRSRVAVDPTQPNLRQVHLIHAELFDELAARGFAVQPGDMGENITTHGVDLLGLPVGTLLHLGASAIVEVTGLRNPCAQLDAFQSGLTAAVLDRDGDGAIVRKAGIMGIVRQGGPVAPDDAIRITLPALPHRPLERV